MEGYIPGRYIYMFCHRENTMCESSLLLCDSPYNVTTANCSYTTGKSGMCSHVVGLLKQLIHCVSMKITTVPVDLSCT